MLTSRTADESLDAQAAEANEVGRQPFGRREVIVFDIGAGLADAPLIGLPGFSCVSRGRGEVQIPTSARWPENPAVQCS